MRSFAFIWALLFVPATAYDVWPMPKEYSTGTNSVSISNVSFVMVDKTPSELLSAAFARYSLAISDGFACSAEMQGNIDKLRKRPSTLAPATLTECSVAVANQMVALGRATDESYTLAIAIDGSCEIEAATQFGALR